MFSVWTTCQPTCSVTAAGLPCFSCCHKPALMRMHQRDASGNSLQHVRGPKGLRLVITQHQHHSCQVSSAPHGGAPEGCCPASRRWRPGPASCPDLQHHGLQIRSWRPHAKSCSHRLQFHNCSGRQLPALGGLSRGPCFNTGHERARIQEWSLVLHTLLHTHGISCFQSVRTGLNMLRIQDKDAGQHDSTP